MGIFPINDCFRQYDKSLVKFLPQFEPIFCDIGTISDDVIMRKSNIVISSLLITHKYIYNLEILLNKLNALYNKIQNDKEMNSFQENMAYVFITQPSSKKIIELMETKQKTTFNKVIMSAYDVIIRKGEKLGLEKGHQLGIDKAKVEIVINAYKKTFP